MESQNAVVCGIIGSNKELIDRYTQDIKLSIKSIDSDKAVDILTWYCDNSNMQQHQISAIPQRAAAFAEHFINAGVACVAIVDEWMRGVSANIAHTIGEDNLISLGDAVATICHKDQCRRVALFGTASMVHDEPFLRRLGDYELITPPREDVCAFGDMVREYSSMVDLTLKTQYWIKQTLYQMTKDGPIDALVCNQPKLLTAISTIVGEEFNKGKEFTYIDAYNAHIQAIVQTSICK